MTYIEQSDQWCEWLYAQEATAADEMLFIYAYIVPFIGLAEGQFDEAEHGDFTPWLLAFIKESALKDNFNDADLAALNTVLDQLVALNA
jgi:hypothetical protein